MLSIQLNRETEAYLAEIIAKEKITSEELLKQLIYDRWQALQKSQTIVERRGGHPNHLLQDAPPDLSLRENRKRAVAEYIKKRHQESRKS